MTREGNDPNRRGLKAMLRVPYSDGVEGVFGDHGLALRKAEEGAARREEAAEWLREMDKVAEEKLPKQPSEEDFCKALRNGIILCNVLNKVNPGAVPKVVDNSMLADHSAQSAIQYFENMRNFLLAVGEMKLLTFQASDLEKGGSSSKVVDCILCIKGYHEWKQSGGHGVWRYGGTVKVVSFPKGSTSASSIGSESADESLKEYESLQHYQLSEFLSASNKGAFDESREAKTLCCLFDQYGLGILKAYLAEKIANEDFSLNAMVIDAVIRKVVKDFSEVLVFQGVQLGVLLNKILKSEITPLSNDEFLDAISKYLTKKTASLSSDSVDLCICDGKREIIKPIASTTANYMEVIQDQQKQIEELKSSLNGIREEVGKIQSTWDEEVSRLGNYTSSLEAASSSYQNLLQENRLLHNQVQDLKGSIRVYCRVRPFLPGQPDNFSTIEHVGENGNIMILHPQKQGRDARKVFSLNKVFKENATQQQIYADTQPLIRSVLDGYNVCIFAYGQTGSGKTYTMSGPDLEAESTWGLNYQALSDLFQISDSRKNVVKYSIGVQMIEIYNEQVRDLLLIDGSTRRYIRNNSQLNGLNVPDASSVPVYCTQDVLGLMRLGQKNRAVGATALNERSSRSHSILTVHVQGEELLSGTILKGCLHLVDLAGSERVDKSEAVGERLREAQHINKSLSALGDVISALAQKSPHVPYRNSKLTQVLQDSLGGQSKTLMLVHINPDPDAVGETISSLKFAERVASIDHGAAKSNREITEIRELKEEVSDLKLMIEKKEAELEQILKNTNKKSLSEPRKGRAILSAKERNPSLLSVSMDRETTPKMALTEEEAHGKSRKLRSLSPPVQRSSSTDRGGRTKIRIKADMAAEPKRKPQFPARVSMNKSMTTAPALSSTKDNKVAEDSLSDALRGLQRPNTRGVLNVRQQSVGKTKQEMKSTEKLDSAQSVTTPKWSTGLKMFAPLSSAIES